MVECGERPFITLWCPLTYKKKRQINIPADKEVNATRYTTVAFTHDSKNILGVSGEPDWLLYAFKCEKGKLESTARANNISNTGYVRQVSQNCRLFLFLFKTFKIYNEVKICKTTFKQKFSNFFLVVLLETN